MIVCQCNVILKAEVEDAARRILAEDPSAALTPQAIYRELGARGRCCSCFPTVLKVVGELLSDACREIDGAGLAKADPLARLLPADK
jgi:bacterioferritin-associated ferredoxin